MEKHTQQRAKRGGNRDQSRDRQGADMFFQQRHVYVRSLTLPALIVSSGK
ncbi:MAG: hypothetical protein HY316_01085 [Acidobacteria bacterium]|nr:hypothetical protein [Acidobacteriota bacterium]